MNRPARDHELLPRVRERASAIAARIGPTTSDGCWIWVGAFTQNGYGTYSLQIAPYLGTSLRAHRAVFMLHHDRAIKEGMTLHHSCHTKECVNPAHLVEMSQEDNQAADATGGASVRYRPTKAGVPRWAVLFREGDKQRSRTFGSLEDAEAYAADRTQLRAAS